MKETVLRIIHSATTPSKDLIPGTSKRFNETIHHCTVSSADSLVQEDINCGLVVSLRIRQLSNPPPPELTRDSYSTVQKLELSCPIEVSWVFGLCSNLPRLNLVRFGSSCFEFPFGQCRPLNESWLTKSHSVKELILTYNHKKLEEPSFDKEHLVDTIDSILYYASKYFVELVKADLYVPSKVKLDWFLNEFPGLRATGDKTELFQKNALYFRSHSYKTDRLGTRLSSMDSSIPLKRTKSSNSEFSISSEDNEPCSTTISPRVNESVSSLTSSHNSFSDKQEGNPIPKLQEYATLNKDPKVYELKSPSPPIDPVQFQAMFTRRPRP